MRCWTVERSLGFTGGHYVRWSISGHVKVQVVSVAGPNAVLSGVVFDGGTVNVPPAVTLTDPPEGTIVMAPATITLKATASDADGITKVEFYGTAAGVDTDRDQHQRSKQRDGALHRDVEQRRGGSLYADGQGV